MNLLEAYKNRLSFADKLYAKNHQGERLNESKKILIAKCLENTQRFMNEAVMAQSHNEAATNAPMGLYTKFSLNLVTAAIPNLIAPEIVMVHPMSSMSGYVSYVKFVAGTDKGATKAGDVFNDPFRIGKVDETYTSARVVEEFTGTSGTASWFPVYTGDAADGKARITAITKADGSAVEVNAGATVTVADDGKSLTFANGEGTAIEATDKVKVAYVYDNIVIPQNDLPTLVAKMDAIPLIAKARRIAIYYSKRVA